MSRIFSPNKKGKGGARSFRGDLLREANLQVGDYTKAKVIELMGTVGIFITKDTQKTEEEQTKKKEV